MQTNCIICLEDINIGDKIIKFKGECKCKALVHYKCGNEWLQLNKNCIICKKEIMANEYEETFYKNKKNVNEIINNNYINFDIYELENNDIKYKKDKNNEIAITVNNIENQNINQIITIPRNNFRHEQISNSKKKKICVIIFTAIMFIIVIFIIFFFYFNN